MRARRGGGRPRRPRCREPSRFPPPRLPRRRGGSPRLAGVSEQDPTARSWGRERERAPRPAAPSSPLPPRRGARSEAGLPFAFAVTSCPGLPSASRGGPGRGAGCLPRRSPWAGRRAGRCRRLARPAAPRQLPSAAAGQGPAGPRWATPSDCSPPDASAWGRGARGGKMGPRCPPRGAACPCQPSEARRGQLLSPPLGLPERRGAVGAPPPNLPPREGRSRLPDRRGRQPRQLSPQLGARVAGRKGGRRARPSSFLRRRAAVGLSLTGRGTAGCRDAPGSPPHTRTLLERPRSREKKLAVPCPRPGRRDPPGESKPPRRESALPRSAASGLMVGLSPPPPRRGEPSTHAGRPQGNARGEGAG